MTTDAELPPDTEIGPHEHEPHGGGTNALLNWLRAAVLGANDGIVSTAGLVMGVAGATTDRQAIFVAGLAGVIAGALSMAAGEYVSVSSQKDTEKALLAKEMRELEEEPEEELAELAGIYRGKGLSEATARQVALELTAHDALAAHAEAELGLDAYERTKPSHAALASMTAFTIGALLPLLTITLLPQSVRIWATVVSVVLALALTGFASARFTNAIVSRAMVRTVGGGLLAMGVTYAVGSLVGANI
ncbi:VIT1/CCC1 transporter family protein [Nocardioides pocheonensis]|jgi:VIT1/CCC1 family predicted Fe2+/Mn2+ transporter|uniref:VIT family protein n=1 Tax=Nocardioides pocheonensis TaxID=661485 RepID=A0A3N0GK45_9ACTN|nr:VIT family protein [Nocardioides pocheonensis]RNM12430.1 VIT family protein [Nocardioides pocheonensis]